MRSFVPVMTYHHNIDIRYTPSTPRKIIFTCLGGLLLIKQRRWCEAQGGMCGAKGPFSPASAIVRCGSEWSLVAGEVRLFYSYDVFI